MKICPLFFLSTVPSVLAKGSNGNKFYEGIRTANTVYTGGPSGSSRTAGESAENAVDGFVTTPE